MNKNDLTKRVAETLGLPYTTSKEIVNVVIDILAESIQTKTTVRIYGLGTFKVVERAARKGRNPKTGEPVDIPAKTVVKFKVSKNLT